MDYLQCVHGVWRVRVVVPPVLRATIGKKYLLRSLDTHDRATARRLARPHLKEFLARLNRATVNKPVVARVWAAQSQHSSSTEWFTPPIVFHYLGVEFDLD